LLKQAPATPAGRIMGIRPEHMDITPSGWPLHVETVELLGAERLVHARLGAESLTLRLDASLPAPSTGESFFITPRTDKLHWFDAQTGQRITTA
jgi:sn-glycerol 3-phosphate transport system ATP-binding protein